jgi:hypothetical protein
MPALRKYVCHLSMSRVRVRLDWVTFGPKQMSNPKLWRWVSVVFILSISSAFILMANKSTYLKAGWTQEKTRRFFTGLLFDERYWGKKS